MTMGPNLDARFGFERIFQFLPLHGGDENCLTERLQAVSLKPVEVNETSDGGFKRRREHVRFHALFRTRVSFPVVFTN